MSETGARIAAHARSLVGTPFRLHGRSAETGLDCVGLVEQCCNAAGRPLTVPPTYALRNCDISAILIFAQRDDVTTAFGTFEAGDILLTSPGPAQHHLLIVTASTHCVHAHAGLRRVVETPMPSPWPILRHWRFI